MSDPIVSVDEETLKGDLRELVRKTAQDTLNALLEQEAEEMVGAGRCERTAGRGAYRSGHCKRKPATTSGQIELDVPKLRGATFRTAPIERCRRREASVEEAIIEMRLAGASTGRIEDVGEILWGAGASAGTVSNLNEKAYKSVEGRRSGPLAGEYPHAFTDGVYLKRSWGGPYENAGVLVAMGVDGDGRREVIGCAGGSRREFPLRPRGRGPRGVRMATGDKRRGMAGAPEEVFPRPGTRGARCTSTAASFPRCPSRGARRSPRCRRPYAPRSRRRPPSPRRAKRPPAPRACGSGPRRGSCARAALRRRPTPTSRCGTGPGSARTTPSSGSTARSGAGRGRSAPSPTTATP